MSLLISIFIIAIVLLTIFVAYDSLRNGDDRAYGLAVATFCIGYIIIDFVSPQEIDSFNHWFLSFLGDIILLIIIANIILYVIAWQNEYITIKLICVYSLTVIFTPLVIAIGYFLSSCVRCAEEEGEITQTSQTDDPLSEEEHQAFMRRLDESCESIRRRERWAEIYGSDEPSTTTYHENKYGEWVGDNGVTYHENKYGEWVGDDDVTYHENKYGEWVRY